MSFMVESNVLPLKFIKMKNKLPLLIIVFKSKELHQDIKKVQQLSLTVRMKRYKNKEQSQKRPTDIMRISAITNKSTNNTNNCKRAKVINR